MSVSVVITIGLPIALFLIFRKKLNLKVLPMLFGIFGFVIFALVLESMVHSLVIGKIIIKENTPVLFIVYAIFMAGIFEESARFISFKILKQKFKGIGTALSYGVGHGGIESILVAGVSLLFALVMGIMVNTGSVNLITDKLTGSSLTFINSELSQLSSTPSYLFLISGLERISAMAIQFSLSVLVFYAVYGKDKFWLYPLAIILHAIIDIPAAAGQAGILKSIPVIEALVLICAVLMLIFARYVHRSFAVDLVGDLKVESGAGEDPALDKGAGL